MKLATTLSKVISLAETIRDYWETELPKRHPKYLFVDPDADDGPPPEEQKLRQWLKRLPEDVEGEEDRSGQPGFHFLQSGEVATRMTGQALELTGRCNTPNTSNVTNLLNRSIGIPNMHSSN